MMYIRAYIILATLYVQDKKISVQILKLKRNILDLVKCVFLLRLRPIFLFIVTTRARCFFPSKILRRYCLPKENRFFWLTG